MNDVTNDIVSCNEGCGQQSFFVDALQFVLLVGLEIVVGFWKMSVRECLFQRMNCWVVMFELCDRANKAAASQ
jgi:hypothetical protein